MPHPDRPTERDRVRDKSAERHPPTSENDEPDYDAVSDDSQPEPDARLEPGSGSEPDDQPVSKDSSKMSSSIADRLSSAFLKPPKPREESEKDRETERGSLREPAPVLSEREKAALVNQIDPTERKIGYAGAVLAAVVGVIRYLPYVLSPNTPEQKTVSPIRGHVCPGGFRYEKVSGSFTCIGNVIYPRHTWILLMAIILVFAAAMFVATRIGRRAALAFTTLMAGLALEAVVQTILALPFVLVGGWLIVRAWRAQRYGSPTAKSAPAGASSSSRSGGSPRSKSATTNTRTGKRSKNAAARVGPNGRVAPQANKRYTPKTPTRRPPPPS